MNNLLQVLGSTRFALALVAISAIFLYAPFLNAPAHLDDQLLISWLTHLQGAAGADFMQFAGFDKLDAWGPFTHFFFIAKAFFIKKSIWLWRLTGLLIHIASSLVVYLIVRRFTIDNTKLLALGSALLFAVYPLSPEAVFWISGKASQLSALFFLLSLYCFLRVKQNKLWFIGLAAFAVLALSTQFNFGVSNQVFNFHKWYQLLRNLFFPINNEVVPKYAREYRFLYFLLAPAFIGVVAAVWKNKRFALAASAALIFVLVLCLPYVGLGLDTRNLYGSRFFYLAAFPVCLLLTLTVTSFSQIAKAFKPLTTAVSGIFLLLLFVFFCRMSVIQISSYRAATHVLQSIQKSAAVVVAKENSPYVFLRDLPRNTSITKAPLEYSVAALEGQTGLLSAWVVPDERLKRQLNRGNYRNSSLRWDKDFLSLVAFDLTPGENQLTELDGPALVARMMPGLVFYRTASYDSTEKLLILESNSTVSGPAVRLAADGLSPVDSDVFYIDARINAPSVSANQEVELYWTTRLYDDYNRQDRRSFAQALVNDGQFHRYYLPLSCAGYYANGTISTITLGFPAGAKVWIKTLGTTQSDAMRPELTIAGTTVNSEHPYAIQYYKYPQIADLGLAAISGSEELSLKYSVSNIAGASSALIEISQPNQFFNNPNGGTLSAACLKQVPLNTTEGVWQLKQSDLKGTGVYSVRLIALGANGQPLGGFSDAINCLAR